jgi:hypothetical protein
MFEAVAPPAHFVKDFEIEMKLLEVSALFEMPQEFVIAGKHLNV